MNLQEQVEYKQRVEQGQPDLVEQATEQAFVAPTAAEKQARLKALVDGADKREAVHQEAGGEDSDAEYADLPRITESAMLRMPESFVVGSAPKPLKLNLRAPVVRVSPILRAHILATFPDVFIAAATSDRFGKGVDTLKVAEFWKLRIDERNRQIKQSNADGKAKAEETGEAFEAERLLPELSLEQLQIAAEEELEVFTDLLHGFDYDDPKVNDPVDANGVPTGKHILNEICAVVWQLAGGDNPGITQQALPALLADHLKVPQFADLLRAIFRCLSGSDTPYESDPYSVFFGS